MTGVALQFLPGTGRWQAAGLAEGAHLFASSAVGPLHHAASRRGPPPRSGEDLR